MSNICPSCGKGCLSPIIRKSPFLIIKESITSNEIAAETIFTLAGHNKYGNAENTTIYYLQKEMAMLGMQMGRFSLTNLYLHLPPTRRRSKEEKATILKCTDFSIAEVIRVAKDMKIILMMGAEVVRTFTGYGVTDVSGLLVKSDYLPNVPVIIPCPNPDKMMSVPIGELRNSLRVLAEQVDIYNQYKDT
jgi:hypothetical protein